MNFNNSFENLSISGQNAASSHEKIVSRGFLNTVVGAGLFLSGAAASQLNADENAGIAQQLETAKSTLDEHQKADANLSELLQRIDSAKLPFDAEAALERALLSVEQRGHQSSIKRAEAKVKMLEAKMERVNQRMDLQSRLEKISYTLRARDCASRPEVWTEFKREATDAFARYEKIQTLKIEDPIRTELIEEMRAAVKEYQTPQGPTDEKAIAVSMNAISKLQDALNIFDASFIAFVQLPAASAMQFVNDKGEESPVFDIEPEKYDTYPFGIATMTKSEKQTSTIAGVVTWKLELDPAFKGTVKIRKNGEWISKQVPPVLEAPAAQPKVEQKKDEKISEEETAVEDEMIVDPSLIVEVDAPYYEEAVSKKGVRHLLKRYVAARTRQLETMEADEDVYGGCCKYRAFVQAFNQEINEISGYSGYGHPDDFDQDQWLSIGVGADKCDEAIERMLILLDRYEQQKENFSKIAPSHVRPLAYAPANAAATKAAIERRKKTMIARFGKLPEKFEKLDGYYAEVLKRFEADKQPNQRLISITLNYWSDASLQATFADAPKKEEVVSSISSFFGGAVKQASAATTFTQDMDPVELREQLIKLAEDQEFTMDVNADSLEALLRIKATIPELVGKDGSFLHGISAEGKSGDIAGTYGPKLEAATAKGQGALELAAKMTGYSKILVANNGGFQPSTINWLLAHVNSPDPFKGIPEGMHFSIVRKGAAGF